MTTKYDNSEDTKATKMTRGDKEHIQEWCQKEEEEGRKNMAVMYGRG